MVCTRLYALWSLLRFLWWKSGTLAEEVFDDGPGTGFSRWSGIRPFSQSYFYDEKNKQVLVKKRKLILCINPKISFGVSPAVAAFAIGFRSPLDQLLLTIFVLCGLTRLARFNVTVSTLPKDASGKSKYFEGTPIPTTMGIAALMAYWAYHGSIHEQLPFGVVAKGTLAELHPMVLMFSVHGSLMISKSLHIPKP